VGKRVTLQIKKVRTLRAIWHTVRVRTSWLESGLNRALGLWGGGCGVNSAWEQPWPALAAEKSQTWLRIASEAVFLYLFGVP
jgi:hypothetical protein